MPTKYLYDRPDQHGPVLQSPYPHQTCARRKAGRGQTASFDHTWIMGPLRERGVVAIARVRMNIEAKRKEKKKKKDAPRLFR